MAGDEQNVHWNGQPLLEIIGSERPRLTPLEYSRDRYASTWNASQSGRGICSIDLARLRVTDDFVGFPSGPRYATEATSATLPFVSSVFRSSSNVISPSPSTHASSPGD